MGECYGVIKSFGDFFLWEYESNISLNFHWEVEADEKIPETKFWTEILP